jgi:excisionase family DNA binding protein
MAAHLKISPDMVRVNGSYDSDCAKAVWDFVRQQASQGHTVQLEVADKWHSPAEVADMLGVSRATVQRRIDDGSVRAVRQGSRWKVSDAEVDRYSRSLMDQMADLVADDLDF